MFFTVSFDTFYVFFLLNKSINLLIKNLNDQKIWIVAYVVHVDILILFYAWNASALN